MWIRGRQNGHKPLWILSDRDLLSKLASKGLCSVRVSVTTLDNTLKRQKEPRTAAPATRLKIIRELTAVGIPAGTVPYSDLVRQRFTNAQGNWA